MAKTAYDLKEITDILQKIATTQQISQGKAKDCANHMKKWQKPNKSHNETANALQITEENIKNPADKQ